MSVDNLRGRPDPSALRFVKDPEYIKRYSEMMKEALGSLYPSPSEEGASDQDVLVARGPQPGESLSDFYNSKIKALVKQKGISKRQATDEVYADYDY